EVNLSLSLSLSPLPPSLPSSCPHPFPLTLYSCSMMFEKNELGHFFANNLSSDLCIVLVCQVVHAYFGVSVLDRQP
ncbi:hypothetical protein, partial [Thiolapillus sp.]|uniref:hypothetical protein n=1 Tax=Thiolapillus sp. TaxID=2017437 RepID=UPI003AF7F371